MGKVRKIVTMVLLVIIISSTIPFSGLVPRRSYAHSLIDQTDPPWIETVEFKQLRVDYTIFPLYNPNVLIEYGVYQIQHDQYKVADEKDMYDWDLPGRHPVLQLADNDPNNKFYVHEECTPPSEMVVYLYAVQYLGSVSASHQLKGEAFTVVKSLVNAGISKTASTYVIPGIGYIYTGFNLVKSLIQRFAWGNAHDYGSAIMFIDPSKLDGRGVQKYTLTTSGGDGMATVTLNFEVTARSRDPAEKKQCSDISTVAYAIPSWVKNNAKWWSEGQVSDKEFAQAIGYLVQQNLIDVQSGSSTQSVAEVSDNIKIPAWIKNNAKWWSEGTVADADFLSGVQYMIDQNIISFSGNTSAPETSANAVTLLSDPETAKSIYSASMWNQVVLTNLLNTKSFEEHQLYDLSHILWNQYAKNMTQENQNQAIEIDNLHKKVQEEGQNDLNLLNKTKQITTSAKSSAIEDGVPESILDDLATTPQDMLGNVKPVQSVDDAKVAIDDAKSAQDHATKTLSDLAKKNTNNSASGADILNYKEKFVYPLISSLDPINVMNLGNLLSGGNKPHPSEDLPNPNVDSPGKQIDSVIPDLQKIVLIGPDEGGSIPPGENTSPTNPNTSPPQEPTGNTNTTTQESSTTGTQVGNLIPITVMSIGGKEYPSGQFLSKAVKGECGYAYHFYTATGRAVSLDLTTIPDPDPGNCGFGKVTDIPAITIWVTQSQVDAFKETTGIDPITPAGTFYPPP